VVVPRPGRPRRVGCPRARTLSSTVELPLRVEHVALRTPSLETLERQLVTAPGLAPRASGEEIGWAHLAVSLGTRDAVDAFVA
jgi:hypothetical protein